MKFARIRRISLAGLAAAALGISATACGGDAEVSANGLEKSEINVGVMQIIEGASVQIAISKGFFKAEGLNVKLHPTSGGAEAIPKLKGGAFDIAHAGHVGVFQAQQQGVAKLQVVLEASAMSKNLNAVLVPKDSPIRTLKDLQGKKIGTNAKKNQISLLLHAALQPHGIKIDEDKSIVEAPFPQQEALLKNKQVDAIIVPEPFVSGVQQSLGARLLSDFSTGPTKDFPITGFAATEEFAKKNPKTVAAFQRAMVKAQALASDRSVLQQEVPKFTKMKPEVVAIVNLNVFPTSTNATRLQRVADVMHQFGYLQAPLDVKPLVLENG